MDRPVEQLVDEILVMDCQSGSVKALEILVSRWQKRLWRYAYRLVGDTEAAWDITQDSWLGIIKGLRKLHDPANFKAWAYRITTNKSIDWIRKSKAVKQISIEELQDHQHEEEEKDTGVKELMVKLDVRKQVVQELPALGHNSRLCTLLILFSSCYCLRYPILDNRHDQISDYVCRLLCLPGPDCLSDKGFRLGDGQQKQPQTRNKTAGDSHR